MADDTPLHMVHGTLEAFYDQGMTGHAWCLHEDGKSGYEGLNEIRRGDILMVFNDAARKEIIFETVVDFDLGDGTKMQWIKNVGAVHGVQKGVEPEVWAQMFVDEKPATLIVHPKNRRA
jgi:hypothetical protein